MPLPEHLVSRADLEADLSFLTGLRASDSADVAASITQFLLANSDSPEVSADVLSLATYAALERLVNANKDPGKLLKRLLETLKAVDGSPVTPALRTEFAELDMPIGNEIFSAWLRDLYSLRVKAGHGFPTEGLQLGWSQPEHLMAGAFVYPLALKCVLAKAGLYRLADDDVAHILGLDGLLSDRPFFGLDVIDGTAELSGWHKQMKRLGEAQIGLWFEQNQAESLNDDRR